MGRSLFSQSYSTMPAVRIEPEPTVDLCEKYSLWNRFDPDSDDFFQDAEYEAFIDPAQYQREQEELVVVTRADVAPEDSESSESSHSDRDSDRGSPMAVGSDDPTILIASYANHPWSTPAASGGWQSATTDHSAVTAGITYNPRRMQSVFGGRPHETEDSDHLGNPVFIPPDSFREPSEPDELPSSPPHSPPTLRRTTDIMPITVPTNPHVVFMPPTRTPSPGPLTTPFTPPLEYQSLPPMLTPSPAPSVTPRFYSWQHHRPIPTVPPSPTLSRGNRDGPFTNPHARVSLMRIDAATARARHSNIVT
jgi:hypothetical protein